MTPPSTSSQVQKTDDKASQHPGNPSLGLPEPKDSSKKEWIKWGVATLGVVVVVVIIICLLNGSDKIPIINVADYNHIESSKGLDYSGAMAADNNLSTSWQLNLEESLPEEGEFGEYDVYGPQFQVSAKKIDYIKLYNGSGRSREAWEQNCRARKVLILRVNPNEYAEADPSDIIYRGPLEDVDEMQKLKVSPTFDNSRPTNFIQVIYLSYFSDYQIGSYTHDLPLSEFEVYGEEIK